MLKVRADQMQVFDDIALEEFEELAVDELRVTLPEETAEWSDEDLADCVREALPRAESYGLETEFEVVCFAQAMILLGDTFDTDSHCVPAQIVLNSSMLPSEEKADLLVLFARALVAEAGAATPEDPASGETDAAPEL